jgi:predicted enzyme related to lactoylglutathione lyase
MLNLSLARPDPGLYLHRKPVHGGVDGGVSDTCSREDNHAQFEDRYLELPAEELASSRDFYANLFGWNFQDYGPTYAAFSQSGTEGGLNADPAERTRAPLPVIESQNIEETEQSIQKAGGKITLPIFSFPGGRRSTSPTPQATN